MKWISLQKVYSEKNLFKLILVMALVIVIAQLANQQDPLERELAISTLVEEEEQAGVITGINRDNNTLPVLALVGDSEPNEGYCGVITLHLVNFYSVSGVKVLVNGAEQADFLHKNVTLQVRSGDRITLDGTNFPWQVIVEVLDTSNGIIKPAEGSIIKVKGNTICLDDVQTNI